MEGNWNTFLPHPFVTGHTGAKLVDDDEARIQGDMQRQEMGKLLLFSIS